MQPDAAVAGKYRDAFREVVECLTLKADQLLEAAFEIEPLGDIVKQISDAAVRIGRGDDAQRAAVGQVPLALLGFDGAIGFVELDRKSVV